MISLLLPILDRLCGPCESLGFRRTFLVDHSPNRVAPPSALRRIIFGPFIRRSVTNPSRWLALELDGDGCDSLYFEMPRTRCILSGYRAQTLDSWIVAWLG